LNKILTGDAIKTLRKIPSESVGLVATSTPYNLKNSTGNGMKDGRGGKWSSAASGFPANEICAIISCAMEFARSISELFQASNKMRRKVESAPCVRVLTTVFASTMFHTSGMAWAT